MERRFKMLYAANRGIVRQGTEIAAGSRAGCTCFTLATNPKSDAAPFSRHSEHSRPSGMERRRSCEDSNGRNPYG